MIEASNMTVNKEVLNEAVDKDDELNGFNDKSLSLCGNDK